MPSCVLIHCKNSQKGKNESKLSYHRIPSDPLMRDEWISIIRKSRKDDKWMPSKCNSFLCSSHFKQEDLHILNDRKILSKTALPTLCLSASRTKSDTKDQILSCPVEIVTVPEFDPPPEIPEVTETIEPKQEVKVLLETYNEEQPIISDDSEIESIFDTPIEHCLRNQLKKKKELAAKQEEKLKELNERFRFLKESNLSMKCEIKKLSKNITCNKRIRKRTKKASNT